MITKNEESFLEQCLNSIKDLVDEIIIVDTGSTDKTKEIAGSYVEFAERKDDDTKIWRLDVSSFKSKDVPIRITLGRSI